MWLTGWSVTSTGCLFLFQTHCRRLFFSNDLRETGHPVYHQLFLACIWTLTWSQVLISWGATACKPSFIPISFSSKGSSRMCLCRRDACARHDCTRDPLTRDLHVVCLLMPSSSLFSLLRLCCCLLDSWVTCYPFTGREFDSKSILPSFILTLFFSFRDENQWDKEFRTLNRFPGA